MSAIALWLAACSHQPGDSPGDSEVDTRPDTEATDTEADTETVTLDTDDTDTTVTGCEAPCRPFPQHTAYAAGTLLPSATVADRDDAVRVAYADWRGTWLSDLGDGRYRVLLHGASSATVSEGQGYGMVIVATMGGEDADAQQIFDGLWRYAQDHPSSIDERLMDWHVPGDESAEPGDDDSAFDGDADIAYGLLLADAQWGSDGAIDYRAAALDVIAGIEDATIGPHSHLPLLGDWVDPSGADYDEWTVRTSDFMPDHFDAFGRATGDASWADVNDAVHSNVDALQSGSAPVTGLLPDFTVPTSDTDHTPVPAPRQFLESRFDGAYSYNAGRDPWRLGQHAILAGDATSRAQAVRISQWVQSSTGGHAHRIKPGYELDGTPLPPGDYFTTFFAAPIGVAAMSDPAAQAWLDDIWNAVIRRREGYFEDTVNLQCLIAMSGNAWEP